MKQTIIESITAGGKTFKGFAEIPYIFPGVMPHTVEMAATRALARQRDQKIYFDCRGLSWEVVYRADYVEEYKARKPALDAPKQNHVTRDRASPPIFDLPLLRRVEKLEAEVKEWKAILGEFKRDFEKARIHDAERFRRLEKK